MTALLALVVLSGIRGESGIVETAVKGAAEHLSKSLDTSKTYTFAAYKTPSALDPNKFIYEVDSLKLITGHGAFYKGLNGGKRNPFAIGLHRVKGYYTESSNGIESPLKSDWEVMLRKDDYDTKWVVVWVSHVSHGVSNGHAFLAEAREWCDPQVYNDINEGYWRYANSLHPVSRRLKARPGSRQQVQKRIRAEEAKEGVSAKTRKLDDYLLSVGQEYGLTRSHFDKIIDPDYPTNLRPTDEGDINPGKHDRLRAPRY